MDPDLFDCIRCGKQVYTSAAYCPHCGLELYPEGEDDEAPAGDPGVMRRLHAGSTGLFGTLGRVVEGLLGRFRRAPSADGLYLDLLQCAGFDQARVERLLDHERHLSPNTPRAGLIRRALQRWQRDNKA